MIWNRQLENCFHQHSIQDINLTFLNSLIWKRQLENSCHQHFFQDINLTFFLIALYERDSWKIVSINILSKTLFWLFWIAWYERENWKIVLINILSKTLIWLFPSTFYPSGQIWSGAASCGAEIYDTDGKENDTFQWYFKAILIFQNHSMSLITELYTEWHLNSITQHKKSWCLTDIHHNGW